mgnify:CR=1 FL=1
MPSFSETRGCHVIIADIDQALEKIYSLKQFHVKLGLDNIYNLLNHIGNPQNELKAFHVAGSNGKGSTCIVVIVSTKCLN